MPKIWWIMTKSHVILLEPTGITVKTQYDTGSCIFCTVTKIVVYNLRLDCDWMKYSELTQMKLNKAWMVMIDSVLTWMKLNKAWLVLNDIE